MSDDNFAHVTSDVGAEDTSNPKHNGVEDQVDVETDQINDVIEIAEKCPGMCIYVEVVPVS